MTVLNLRATAAKSFAAAALAGAVLLSAVSVGANGAVTAKAAQRDYAVRSAGKQTAPVAVTHRIAGKPQLGLPVAVDLEFQCEFDCESLAVAVNADGDLQVDRGPDPISLGAIQAGETRALRVWVTPQREGRHYLNVTAQTRVAARMQMRALAIKIDVGDARQRKSAAAGDLRKDADGRKVIVMPATEPGRARP